MPELHQKPPHRIPLKRYEQRSIELFTLTPCKGRAGLLRWLVTRRFSQEEFAGKVGSTRGHIRNLITGFRDPGLDLQRRIIEFTIDEDDRQERREKRRDLLDRFDERFDKLMEELR